MYIFDTIKFSDTLSIFKTNINIIDNTLLSKDLEYNCEVLKNTSYPSKYSPGIQSDIHLISKNINLLKNIITDQLINFFNLDENYLFFSEEWVYISENKNVYNTYHTHDVGPNIVLTKEKPQWTLAYYVSMPEKLIENDGKLFFKENDIEYSVLPNIGDLILFPANVLHKPENNIHSKNKRIVYVVNIALLNRDKEYNKKNLSVI